MHSVRRLGTIPNGKPPRLRWLGLAGLLLVIGFCGLAAYVLAEMRTDTRVSTERTSNNLLAAVTGDLDRNLEFYDLSLQAVVAGLAMPGLWDLDLAVQKAVLFDRATTARYLGAVHVVDETGKVVISSTGGPPSEVNLAGRDYFEAQRDGSTGLYLSPPFRRFVSGKADLAVALSRRVSKPDGSFGGIVVLSLRLDYFRDLFARFENGQEGSMNLMTTDGTIIMRAPYNEALIGSSMAQSGAFKHALGLQSGSYSSEGKVDGIRRIYSFMRVGDHPLALFVGVSEREIFASWWSRAAVIGAVLITLCAGAGGLGVLFAREMRRRTRAEHEMRQSEAQYRLLADNATDVIIRFDDDLIRRYVSPASQPVLGYPPVELLRRHPRETTHPDDWPELERLVGSLRDGVPGIEATYRFRHRAGHWVWVEANYSRLPELGGFAAVLRDITRRKHSEQQLEAANSQLERIAITDGLTGLRNRRGFDEALAREWRVAVQNQKPLSLLLLDVDRFKLFNDHYGHVEGDECLREVGRTVGEAAQRPGDMAARYGGEELAVLLPGAEEGGAASVAEAVRAAVAALAIPHQDNPAGGHVVTISVGVASVVPSSGASLPSAQDLVAAADAALYRAKRGGRNRVACASGSEKESLIDRPALVPSH